jgi:hypothetical protein
MLLYFFQILLGKSDKEDALVGIGNNQESYEKCL